MVQATTEGTQVMSAGLAEGLMELNLTEGELEAIKKRGEKFDFLLGRAEDADNVVSFVYENASAASYMEGSSATVALVVSIVIAVLLVGAGVIWRVRAHQ
jgi:hypothetical protein